MNPHSRNGHRIYFKSCVSTDSTIRASLRRAKNGTRTRDPDLGKVVLYQLSYFRIVNMKMNFRLCGCKDRMNFIFGKDFLKNNWRMIIFALSKQEIAMANNGKRRIAGSYVASTLSIALVLVVIGVLAFIFLNARQISDHVKQNIGFSIIVKDKVNDAEIKKLQKILDTKSFVASSVFISKEEAAKEFKRTLGEDFEAVLGYNPLLPSIEIKLNPAYANNDSLAVIEKRLLENEAVQEVSYQKSLVQMVNDNVEKISLILLVAGALLMLISFTLIRNTIHLSVYSQRFLIKTMQLVGAKTSFVCRPFIQNSIWLGFFASMFANLILLGAIYLLQQEAGGVLDLMDRNLLIVMVAFVTLCGIFLSWLSAWVSVVRYLSKDMNDLYN